MTTSPDLSRLLAPQSIAVIGASDSAASLGGRVVRFLQKFHYPGAVWPVNPGRETVAGMPCFKSLRDLPQPADLAILAVSVEGIADAVIACAEAGIFNGIAWANGFAEIGGEGVERQRMLGEVCRKHGFNLCGPNCLGIINTWQPMVGSFQASLQEEDRLLQGGISMVSQSGGMISAVQMAAMRFEAGFRYQISSGNEAVLQSADYISALVDDAGTKVIVAYMEGCNDGPRLIEALAKARDAGKPVVVLKAGMTPASAKAAVAHTGILAGEGRIWEAVFRDNAVIQVESTNELLDVALFLDAPSSKIPAGRNVAVIGFGGGNCVLCADYCVRNILALPGLTAESSKRLKPLVPPMASIANPFDLTPQMAGQPQWLANFPQVLDIIAADPNIDAIFFQFGALGPPTPEVSRIVSEFALRTPKSVFLSWSLAPETVFERMRQNGIHVFHDAQAPFRTMNKLLTAKADAVLAAPVAKKAASDFDWHSHAPVTAAGTVISEHECHRVLRAAGLPMADGRLAVSEGEAVTMAAAVCYPVAMKGISSTVTHRAAAGLLSLDVRSDAEVRDTYQALTEHAAQTGVRLDGIYVQHMEEGRLELLVSAFRDPVFGVMITCGAGGNLAEIIDDVVIQPAPFSRETATSLLQRLRMVRRSASLDKFADLDALGEFVARFSEVAAVAPWKKFVLEINPVKWQGRRVVAVDGLLIIEEP